MIQNGNDSTPSRSAFPSAPEKADLGQILLRQGIVRKEQLDECLVLQRTMAIRPGAAPPRLGELLVQKGYCTREAIAHALGEQSKKVLFCPGCGILVNVDLRPDAIGYKCGRCEAPLIEPPPGSQTAAIDSSIIVHSRIPVPSEVKEAREDPSRKFGKYVILAEIGRGGIAAVYRAWDTYLNQYVALKRIKPVPQSQVAGTMMRKNRIASLLNEAHNAIRLRHPNIVSVYDIGRVETEYYISMEYLEGRTLLEEIQAARHEGKVSPYHDEPRKYLGVLYQVAHALHYAHTRPIPILHCDLKPGNVFVSRDGSARILDFGLARSLGEIEIEGGTISGTPSYMSPEQASGRSDELDPRTDVYGLGAVLYELLAGRPPFTGEIADVLRRTIEETPVAPAELAWSREGSGGTTRRQKMVPPELNSLCVRCLAKTPDERPASAMAFAEEIARISAGGHSAMPRSAPTTAPTVRGPAVRPPRSSRVLPWAMMLLLIPAAAAGTYLLHPHLKGWIEPVDARMEIVRHLAAFRPDLAGNVLPDLRTRPDMALMVRDLDAVAGFKQSLADQVAARRPVAPEFPLGARTLRIVRFSKVRAERVLFTADGEADEATWEELGPAGILRLARVAGADERPSDRWGLAVYCAAAGAVSEARELLRSLENSEYSSAAQELLGRLGN